MLSLLSDFLQPWADLVPRFSHRPSSVEWCVWDSPIWGPRVTRWPVLHCPAITHVEYYPATTFPVDLEVQTLNTVDDQEITVNACISVTIDDPLSLRDTIGSEDYVGNISMRARSVIQDFVCGHNREYGMRSIHLLEAQLYDALLHLTCEGGRLESLCIEDAAPTSSFRRYGSLGL